MIELLEKYGPETRILAGGHSLLPMMKLRLANPERLIDINELDELSYIREADGEIRIGAMTRHRELLESELLAEAFPDLRRRRERDRRSRRSEIAARSAARWPRPTRRRTFRPSARR